MHKKDITQYFLEAINSEPAGTPCHGCYSYAYALLLRADTWEQYMALLAETENDIATLIHMRSSDVKVFTAIYGFIRVVAYDYMKEDRS